METEQKQMPGGLNGASAITPEVQAIAQSVKPAVEEELKRKLDVYHAISFHSQVVAGTNYFIKIAVGLGDDYIHVRVFEPLPQEDSKPTVKGLQRNKKLFDKIEFF